MFSRIFPRVRREMDSAAPLYGAIVAQARSTALYAEIGVPDDVGGRFEMVVLHAILLIRRLEMGGEAARAAGQRVFDHFCSDMDNSLREMGIGDLSVPKHMRRVGEAYFGRMTAYQAGLSGNDASALAEAIERTVFGGDGASPPAHSLAAYALAAAKSLGRQSDEAIVSGSPDFPDADAFFSAGANP